jgi:threonine synthase
VVAVSESEIAQAEARSRGLGLWVEPSSATALAALQHLRIGADDTVVVMLTAHGIKTL